MGHDVIGIGYAGVDQLCQLPVFPRPGSKNPVTSYLRQGGGQTATAMTALARWGQNVAAVCAVGDDDLGRDAIDELAADGVDTAHMVVRAGHSTQTSMIFVEQDSGERTIVYHRDLAINLQPGDLDLELLEHTRCLFLDGHEELGLVAARRAQELGVCVVLDAERLLPLTEQLLPLCDVVLCGNDFPGQLTGEPIPERQLQAMAARGIAIVGMTQGDQGCLALSEGTLTHRPAFRTDVVDTTGAGDVFHAGFTYAHLSGHPLPECLDFANAAAALKCTAPGGRTGIPHDPQRIWDLVTHGERHQRP